MTSTPTRDKKRTLRIGVLAAVGTLDPREMGDTIIGVGVTGDEGKPSLFGPPRGARSGARPSQRSSVTRHRMISEREIFVGTLASATVAPRDVFRFALSDHASSVILFHNHPSGDPSPSPQDLAFTTRLVGIGEALGVAVLDHLIVTANSFLSFKQREFV
jgi:hypothetical protein